MTLKAHPLKMKDLPYVINLQGENGESILFQIVAAGRKFGASLTKVDPAMCELLKK